MPLGENLGGSNNKNDLADLIQKDVMVGWCYNINYGSVNVMTNDLWKEEANGVPHNCLLLATSFDPDDFDKTPEAEKEVLLMRVIGSTDLPQKNYLLESKIEHFQDQRDPFEGEDYDDITKNKMQFHGLRCRILGTFYEKDGDLYLGSDIESFSSAAKLRAYRPHGDALETVVNYLDPNLKQAAEERAEEMGVEKTLDPFKIGAVRYTSTDRLHRPSEEKKTPVFVNPKDFLARRTAVLGMTRTGKSNTIKQLVSVVKRVSDESDMNIGQIIYDVNGEYANVNEQDKGALAEIYPEDEVIRYTTHPPEGSNFKELRTNFYYQLNQGISIIKRELQARGDLKGDYRKMFANMVFDEPPKQKEGEYIRYQRKVAAYWCILYKAGFEPSKNHKKISFKASKKVRSKVNNELGYSIDTTSMTLDEAVDWFKGLHEVNKKEKLKSSSGKDWIDDELQNLLTVLNKEKGGRYVSGYQMLTGIDKFHSEKRSSDVTKEIYNYLKDGKIVILDISLMQPSIRKELSRKIAQTIFSNSMEAFVDGNQPPNIAVYTEESHNLIGKDQELDEAWPRLAKEGAKYNISLIYATQEISSVHSSILANTENWFISHLNNRNEIKELEKFYDFEDFSESLLRAQDVGFTRVKTLSSPFVIPVQIDKFEPDEEKKRVENLTN